jgi:hypothetical protein
VVVSVPQNTSVFSSFSVSVFYPKKINVGKQNPILLANIDLNTVDLSLFITHLPIYGQRIPIPFSSFHSSLSGRVLIHRWPAQALPRNQNSIHNPVKYIVSRSRPKAKPNTENKPCVPPAVYPLRFNLPARFAYCSPRWKVQKPSGIVMMPIISSNVRLLAWSAMEAFSSIAARMDLSVYVAGEIRDNG